MHSNTTRSRRSGITVLLSLLMAVGLLSGCDTAPCDNYEPILTPQAQCPLTQMTQTEGIVLAARAEESKMGRANYPVNASSQEAADFINNAKIVQMSRDEMAWDNCEPVICRSCLSVCDCHISGYDNTRVAANRVMPWSFPGEGRGLGCADYLDGTGSITPPPPRVLRCINQQCVLVPPDSATPTNVSK